MKTFPVDGRELLSLSEVADEDCRFRRGGRNVGLLSTPNTASSFATLTRSSAGFGSGISASTSQLLVSSWLLIISCCELDSGSSPFWLLLLNAISDESAAIPPSPKAAISWGRSGRDFLRLIWRLFWNHICNLIQHRKVQYRERV